MPEQPRDPARARGRIRVGVLHGGAFTEREASLAAGRAIAEQLPQERYDIVTFDTFPVFAAHPRLPSQRPRRVTFRPVSVPRPEVDGPYALRLDEPAAAEAEAEPLEALVRALRDVDVALIALHGPQGEGGCLQALLELARVPYVGSGVLASALALDKTVARRMLEAEEIAVPRAVVLERDDLDPSLVRRAQALLPALVKPARQGAGLGISAAYQAQDLDAALQRAFTYDTRVLVEERLEGRELTVAVVGSRRLSTLPPVEVVFRGEPLDRSAAQARRTPEYVCPAPLTPAELRKAEAIALRAHRALECRGLSQVDMIFTPNRGAFALEVNTLPPMAPDGLLMKAARAAGFAPAALLDRLVRLAIGDD